MNQGLVDENLQTEFMPPQAPRRRRVSTAKRVLIACVIAVLMFGAVLGGLYFSGWRYESIEAENGVTIKFLGVIKDGKPVKGKIVYSSGLTGVIEEGSGIISYNDGSRYLGELGEDLRKNGKGKLTFASGNIYEGDFKSDSMTGKATLTYTNGDTYVGDFVDGKKTGEGTYTWEDGSVYTGGLKDDLRHGKGSYTDADGSSYVGDYNMGIKDGSGIYTWADGDKYTGEFKNDMRHGKGTYEWKNGDKYEGDFFENNMTGFGTFTYSYGRTYTGEFKNGIMVYPD
ncbi:MAG: hypothetical protein IJF74_01350 [Clostridia bacterium]|nr:hypothetical protein [Clostridia bacterium]